MDENRQKMNKEVAEEKVGIDKRCTRRQKVIVDGRKRYATAGQRLSKNWKKKIAR